MYAETAGEILKARKNLNFFAFLSGLSIIVGLFFLSPNLTGNTIGDLSAGSTNLLGIGLIALGILGFWFFSKFINSYL